MPLRSLNILTAALMAPADGGLGGAVEKLHDLKAVNRDTSADEFATSLNQVVAAVREVAGDAAKVREKVDNALPGLEAKFAAAKRSEGVEIVPLGDVRDFEARYILEDGSVLLGKRTESVELPDGSTHTWTRKGMLLDNPVTPGQLRVQRAYASYTLAFKRAAFMARMGGGVNDDVLGRAFTALRTELLDLPGRAGTFFRDLFARPGWSAHLRAINNTAGIGAEMVLNPQLTTIRQPRDLERRIPGLFELRDAPSKIFTPIIATGRAIPTIRGVVGDDPSMFETSNFTTSSTSVTVVDRDVNARLDTLWVADAAKILGDPLGFVSEWLDQGDLLGLEIAMLHGDTTASHMDTVGTWTINGLFSAGALAGSNKLTRAWKGLRRIAYDDSTFSSGGGTWDIADHTTALAAMGNWESGAVIVTGLNCLLTSLVGNANFLTVDKAGPYASLFTGAPGMTTAMQAGAIGGKPIYISETMGKQFDTTTGLYTGSNLGNEMVYVNPRAFKHYSLAEGADAYDVIRSERGQQIIGFTRRSILVKETVTGEKPVAVVYNLTA